MKCLRPDSECVGGVQCIVLLISADRWAVIRIPGIGMSVFDGDCDDCGDYLTTTGLGGFHKNYPMLIQKQTP